MLKRGVKRKKKEKESKGLSTVIATLLIIMLTLIVIGILWVVLRNVIINQSEIVGVQKEFFAENVEILSFKVNGSLVNFSLKKIGGEIISKNEINKTEIVEEVEVDIISVVDLSGSMTQCSGVSSNCCTNTLRGTSYDSGLRICYGANTNKGTSCISACGENWYLISGEYDGVFNGYSWSGTNWISNSVVVASLPDIGANSAPSVFQKDGNWYLIAGEYDGVFNGYTLATNGTTWLRNTTIIASLPDVGSNSAPSVFQKDGNWYLISGNLVGTFNGYAWNGTQWRVNTTINASLPDIGANSAPSIFQKDGTWMDRLTPTKEANKELVNILSQSEGNRIGFVVYSTSINITASLNLTNNATLLNKTIDFWQPNTSTCICCGINEASRRLAIQSSNETSKKIIVMSDGEANVLCTQQNTSNAIRDATKSSCDAKTFLQNLVVHSIGAGDGVNQDALINISVCGGGKYFSAINISELIDVYKRVAEE
ncbi:MAG: VWA domain-containing protein, partial [Candidatus Pacearchaeota archaeon]|nr:VWA domain-containing protein [Candidatus Pacearchaeota archaeon]